MLAAGAKFVVREFIGAGGGALNDVGDAEFQVEKEGSFKGRKDARREAAALEGRPEAVAGAAEVPADSRGVQPGVDAGEEDDEVLGDKIRDDLVVRGEDLGFGGFPRCRQLCLGLVTHLRTLGTNPLRQLAKPQAASNLPYRDLAKAARDVKRFTGDPCRLR